MGDQTAQSYAVPRIHPPAPPELPAAPVWSRRAVERVRLPYGRRQFCGPCSRPFPRVSVGLTRVMRSMISALS
jgi:hypothetical protein